MAETDLAALRDRELTEEEVLAVIALVSFFNLANRLADALGVELDPQFERGTPEHEALARHIKEG